MNEMFKKLEELEEMYDKGYVTLDEYYKIKERIIDKNKIKKYEVKRAGEIIETFDNLEDAQEYASGLNLEREYGDIYSYYVEY